MRIAKSAYANDRHLRKNPFWPIICDMLPKHGFHWFYGESGNTCHVHITVFDPKLGKEKEIKYAFPRTAALNSTVPNFKSSLGRFLREQVMQKWGLQPPDPDKHAPHVDDKKKSVSLANAEALFNKAMTEPPTLAPPPPPPPTPPIEPTPPPIVEVEVIDVFVPVAPLKPAPMPALIEPREVRVEPDKVPDKSEPRMVVAFAVPVSKVGDFISVNHGLADFLYAKQLREAEPAHEPAPTPIKSMPSVAATTPPADSPVAAMPAAYPRRHRFVDGKRLDEKILDVMRKQPGVIFTSDSLAQMVHGYDSRSYASTLSRLYRDGLIRKTGTGMRSGKYLVVAKPR